MRRALKIAATIAIGIALGLAATWVTAIRGTMSGGVSDGPWSTSLDTGSSESGLYLRARIAVHGLLALSREETVYYSALRDSDWRRSRRQLQLPAGRSRSADALVEHHGLWRRRFPDSQRRQPLFGLEELGRAQR